MIACHAIDSDSNSDLGVQRSPHFSGLKTGRYPRLFNPQSLLLEVFHTDVPVFPVTLT
jgi:hypothetical protein